MQYLELIDYYNTMNEYNIINWNTERYLYFFLMSISLRFLSRKCIQTFHYETIQSLETRFRTKILSNTLPFHSFHSLYFILCMFSIAFIIMLYKWRKFLTSDFGRFIRL